MSGIQPLGGKSVSALIQQRLIELEVEFLGAIKADFRHDEPL
jgi:hypothetical protein